MAVVSTSSSSKKVKARLLFSLVGGCDLIALNNSRFILGATISKSLTLMSSAFLSKISLTSYNIFEAIGTTFRALVFEVFGMV